MTISKRLGALLVRVCHLARDWQVGSRCPHPRHYVVEPQGPFRQHGCANLEECSDLANPIFPHLQDCAELAGPHDKLAVDQLGCSFRQV